MGNRKIQRKPAGTNFYLIDACFLVNKYLPFAKIPSSNPERMMVELSQAWWSEIDGQIKDGKAIVYIPDVCIAESFKVLAQKYYRQRLFTAAEYRSAKQKLSDFVHIPARTLQGSNRRIKVHDISTSRDIIIAVDRFYEFFAKKNLNVSVVDLIILATAKYLMDFFLIPKKQLYIVTLDNPLWKGTKSLSDIPSAFNPSEDKEKASKVFV